jgi:hypothetical protein
MDTEIALDKNKNSGVQLTKTRQKSENGEFL